MIVADASTVVLALLNEGDARRQLLAHDVAVPHLVDVEVAHAMRRQLARGSITAQHGRTVLGRWVRLGVRRFPVAGLIERVWELRDNVTAYDAVYVALAEVLGCGLVTADARLAHAPGPTCPVTVVRR